MNSQSRVTTFKIVIVALIVLGIAYVLADCTKDPWGPSPVFCNTEQVQIGSIEGFVIDGRQRGVSFRHVPDVLSGPAAQRIELNNNGGSNYGAMSLLGGNVTASCLNVHDNRMGAVISNGGRTPITISNASFVNNTVEGLFVDDSESTITNGYPLMVSNSTFSGSQRGINITAAAGPVWAFFQGNTVSGNSSAGFAVTGTASSTLTFLRNTAVNNNGPGFALSGVSPSAGNFVFQGNVVHHNTGDQIVVAAATKTWDLRGSNTGSCVPSTANVIACYNRQPTPSSSVGIRTAGATVLADGNSWQNASPVSGTDFAGSISPAPPVANCVASTIACPCDSHATAQLFRGQRPALPNLKTRTDLVAFLGAGCRTDRYEGLLERAVRPTSGARGFSFLGGWRGA